MKNETVPSTSFVFTEDFSLCYSQANENFSVSEI